MLLLMNGLTFGCRRRRKQKNGENNGEKWRFAMTAVHKNILASLSICLLTLLWSTSLRADEGFLHFPVARSESFSPGRKYVLYNVDAENDEPNHTLFLKDTRSGAKRKLYAYGRHVDIFR